MARIGVAFKPLYPKHLARITGPFIQALLERVDVHKEIARRCCFIPGRLHLWFNGKALVIEAEGILLVDQNQIFRPGLLPQPGSHADDVLACKPLVQQIGAQGRGKPNEQRNQHDQPEQTPALDPGIQRHRHQQIESGRDKAAVAHIKCAPVKHRQIV